jgi:hypothetical protein
MAPRQCPCGSGLFPSEVFDARGIYVAAVCNVCEKRRLAQFRPEIFTDPDYDAPDLGDDEGGLA